MGAGASSLNRLRKAIVIRSYNLRKPNETIDEQFRKYSFRGEDNVLCIAIKDVRACLCMEDREYAWIENLFEHTFNGKIASMNYSDFIRFLETGQTPGTSDIRKTSPGPSRSNGSDPLKFAQQQQGNSKNHEKNRPKGFPPIPPINGNSINTSDKVEKQSPRYNNNVVDAASIRIEKVASITSNQKNGDDFGLVSDEENEETDQDVIHINLSNIAESNLPSSVKLKDDGIKIQLRSKAKKNNSENSKECDEEDEEYAVMLHPKHIRRRRSSDGTVINSSNDDEPVKPLWRKRETVRQERTVHYTTLDADGMVQELIEKETTQTEVLHMECRETGEFAHRETTKYEQLETFNEEVVAEVTGAEEYVHLKSIEDEYHYMESTMPKKEDPSSSSSAAGADATAAEAGEKVVGDEDKEHYTAEEYAEAGMQDPATAAAAAGYDNMTAEEQREFEEAYRQQYRRYLYHKQQYQKLQQQQNSDEGVVDDSGGEYSNTNTNSSNSGNDDDMRRRKMNGSRWQQQQQHHQQQQQQYGEKLVEEEHCYDTTAPAITKDDDDALAEAYAFAQRLEEEDEAFTTGNAGKRNDEDENKTNKIAIDKNSCQEEEVAPDKTINDVNNNNNSGRLDSKDYSTTAIADDGDSSSSNNNRSKTAEPAAATASSKRNIDRSYLFEKASDDAYDATKSDTTTSDKATLSTTQSKEQQSTHFTTSNVIQVTENDQKDDDNPTRNLYNLSKPSSYASHLEID